MRTAKLFLNGRSQAVRLPKEFNMDGNKVYIKRHGNAVVLLPLKGIWDNMFNAVDDFSADFMSSRSQPKVQDRENF